MEQITDPDALESLMKAAMAGDRDAMARIFETYDEPIRRRLRGKLSSAARGLFDSNDLLWCTAASLDRYIVAGRLDVERPEQLWALIFRIGECEAARQSAIAARHPACDLATAPAEALTAPPGEDETAPELPGAGDLPDADRELLMLKGRGCSLAMIARLLGRPPATVRKRWERLRRRLREARSQDKDRDR